MTEQVSSDPGEWRFDDLRALYINCTLKRSPERSHTQGLIDRSRFERLYACSSLLNDAGQYATTGGWPAAASTSRTPNTASASCRPPVVGRRASSGSCHSAASRRLASSVTVARTARNSPSAMGRQQP
jgi:hypothetical protein